jgi:hypothetical protein
MKIRTRMKLNKKKLEEYRKTHRSETFGEYDVTLAMFLIDNRKNVEIINVDVAKLAERLGFTQGVREERDGYIFFSDAVIDEEHFAKGEADFNKPLIFLSNDKLLDGHHRSAHAWMQGVKTLPAIILTEEETREINGSW